MKEAQAESIEFRALAIYRSVQTLSLVWKQQCDYVEQNACFSLWYCAQDKHKLTPGFAVHFQLVCKTKNFWSVAEV
jgi:hypothetical protein